MHAKTKNDRNIMPDLVRYKTFFKSSIFELPWHLFDLAAYEFLYRFSPARSNKFFNGGYLPVADDMVQLPEFADEQHSVMMYHLIAKALLPKKTAIPTSILDIGCGQGGGVRYVSKLFPDAEIVGIDRNGTVTRLANSNYGETGKIEFRKSHSDTLDFPDGSFDMVLSVGAPTYFGLKKYVAEANRVCMSGGTIAFSGGYRQGNHTEIEKELRDAAADFGLEFVSYHDITPNTFASLKADIPRREKLLKKVPWPFRIYGEKWADMPGSTEYEEYATGKRTDFAAVTVKALAQNLIRSRGSIAFAELCFPEFRCLIVSDFVLPFLGLAATHKRIFD